MTLGLRWYHVNSQTPIEETNMTDPVDTIEKAAEEARRAARELSGHPNSKPHIRARTMALVALVAAYEAAGHVGEAQTRAALKLGHDRQLIHRHIKRAVDRGWASVEQVGRTKRLVVNRDLPPIPRQTEFSDVVDMETITKGQPGNPLPPFGFRGPPAVI